MKNITLNEQINLFWKNKAKETLVMRTQELAYACIFLHAYAGPILRMHIEFQKLNKASFLH